MSGLWPGGVHKLGPISCRQLTLHHRPLPPGTKVLSESKRQDDPGHTWRKKLRSKYHLLCKADSFFLECADVETRKYIQINPWAILLQIPHLRLTPWHMILLIQSSRKAHWLPWMHTRAPLTHYVVQGGNQSSWYKLQPQCSIKRPPGPGSNQLHSWTH